MELMIPAGNINSFLVGLDNGADSIYLGLKKFNARKPANNFSLNNFKKALKIAHDKGKKIFLTLNVDLKSRDLLEVAQILELAKELKVDALIVKDPAVVYILKNFYKDAVVYHYSTQNAVCSSLGVKFVKKEGAKRVVLARELGIDEINSACAIDGIECEVFVEGSMCFSISGRCLLSSWVGGKSGNRGVCAAPCRVLWKNRSEHYPFFSMKDLSLITFLEELRDVNVSAVKVEGRLKSALWVKGITYAYRNTLDNMETGDGLNIKELSKELKKYSAREIDKGHIFSHGDLIGKNEEWTGYQKTQNLSVDDSLLTSKSEIHFDLEDKLLKIKILMFDNEHEVSLKIPEKPKKAKVLPASDVIKHLGRKIVAENNFKIYTDGLNFAAPSSFIKKISKSIVDEVRIMLKEEEQLPQISSDIIDFIAPKSDFSKRDRLLGDLPDKIIIRPDACKKLLDADFNNIKTVVIVISKDLDVFILKELAKKYHVILSIPAVLFEKDAKEIYEYVLNLNKNDGFKYFEANSYTGMQILSEIDCVKSLGYEMSVMNHLAAGYFYDMGYVSLYSSVEADVSTSRAVSRDTITSSSPVRKLDCLAFGRIPLFQSRVKSPIYKKGEIFEDNIGVKLECFKQNDINLFVATEPFSLIGDEIKNEQIFFDALAADLRFFSSPFETLASLFNNKFDLKNSKAFNFQRKLQ